MVAVKSHAASQGWCKILDPSKGQQSVWSIVSVAYDSTRLTVQMLGEVSDAVERVDPVEDTVLWRDP
jgi:hypothetical protein